MSDALRELEKRLESEPDNLPLRVTIAGLLHEATRNAEAVELYRSVALAYRDQGRGQQAMAVCRSILELAPDDAACLALLAELSDKGRVPVEAPARRSSFEATPLPRAVPYHISDPTTAASLVARDEVESDLPVVEGAETRPGGEPARLETAGLAQAARRISGLIAQEHAPDSGEVDLAAELDTRQRPRISALELDKISAPPPTVPVDKMELEDMVTPVRDAITGLDDAATGDDELTLPRELVPTHPIDNAFFVPLPANRREAALARCVRRDVRAGTTVIRSGEMAHPLFLVVSGRLEQRCERANGSLAQLESIDPGQYIGEAALLARTPAQVQVVAAEDCELLAIPPHALFELAGAYPALWAALKDSAERRTRQLDRAR